MKKGPLCTLESAFFKVGVCSLFSLSASNSVSVMWGWDLKFLRTKKPARVADKNTRMNLRGHMFPRIYKRLCVCIRRIRIWLCCGAGWFKKALHKLKLGIESESRKINKRHGWWAGLRQLLSYYQILYLDITSCYFFLP